jgi:ABC-type sugar transport system ATPase subunit
VNHARNRLAVQRDSLPSNQAAGTIRPVASVEFHAVTKTFHGTKGRIVRAVNRASFSISSGELVTIVGPSGCGKTTLLRLIAGLETPDEGNISFDGKTANALEPNERDVAMVFQRDALFPHLTAGENISFGLKLRRVPRGEIRQRTEAIATLLGVTDCLSCRPGQLSGGQRQRVALGRALVRNPKILLLDEPFANLDAPFRRELRRQLLRIHDERGLTMLLVTHDQAEALAMGQRVAVMNAGAIEQIGTPAEVSIQPATRFVAEFLNADVV